MTAPQLSHFRAEVPAGIGRATMVNATGELVVIRHATEPFELSLNDGSKMPCEVGFVLRHAFSRITFYNRSADNTLQVEFYVGIGQVDFLYLPYSSPPTTIVRPSGAINLGAGASETFSSVYLPGYRRKFFSIQNDDAAGRYVRLRSAGNSEMGIVYPKLAPLIWETDVSIVVFNGNGVAVPIVVCEIFQLSSTLV